MDGWKENMDKDIDGLINETDKWMDRGLMDR